MSLQNRKEVLQRTYIVGAFFVFLSVMVFAQLINIKFIKGQDLREMGKSQTVKEKEIFAERGNILSDDQNLLATSLPYFTVHFDPLASKEYVAQMCLKDKFFMSKVGDIWKKNIDSLAIYISKELKPNLSPNEIKLWLQKQRSKKSRYLLLAKDLNYEQIERVKKFPLFRLGQNKSGIIISQEYKRIRPYGDMALRTVGYTSDNSATVGIEGAYNQELKGEKGKRLMQFIKPNAWIPINDLTEIEPRNGNNVITTINVKLQDIAQQALDSALHHHQAANGCAIVMDVKTGAIKAMVNLTRHGVAYKEDYNYAIAYSVEPGSTYKLATVMSILEDKKMSLEDEITVNFGLDVLAGKEMKDSETHGYKTLTLRQAFELSSNIGISKAALKAYPGKNGAHQFINRLRSFHLDKTIGIDIAGEGKPYIKTPFNLKQRWSRTTIPWMAHGYELKITPLQLLAFYNAVANNGKLMKPYLVSAISSHGQIEKEFNPTILHDQLASPSTIKQAQSILKGVVENGTAKSGKNSNYTFAGKTGTTSLDYGGIKRGRYRASFIGYFPAENPVYSCYVMITEPKNGYYGAETAMPVFKSIADKCMSFDPNFFQKIVVNQDRTTFSKFFPNMDKGYSNDYITVLESLNIPSNSNSLRKNGWVTTQIEASKVSLNNFDITNSEVPDVRGMGLRDALYVLEKQGLKVEIDGVGKVSYQNILPGTKSDGQTVLITLN